MGNWNMTVVGVGCHHNMNNPSDADKMFAEFVEKLKAAGHGISHASITYGGAQIEVKQPAEPGYHVHYIGEDGKHYQGVLKTLDFTVEPRIASEITYHDWTGDGGFGVAENVPYAHPSESRPNSFHYPHDRK